MRRPRSIGKERQQAINEGKDTYCTGKPCKRGHIAERFTKTHTCVECSRVSLYQTDRDRYRSMQNTMIVQFRQRKNTALKMGIPFTIELDQIEQPKYCPVLGIELNYAWGGTAGHLRDPAKATIDKVIPELGYVPKNVYIISWRANKLKSDMTLEELEKIMKYMKARTE
ncbi:MAG: hypothetical protein ACOVLB_00075 [Candidatus Nanopelagicus sp.]